MMLSPFAVSSTKVSPMRAARDRFFLRVTNAMTDAGIAGRRISSEMIFS
jgi:hypothetical protein